MPIGAYTSQDINLRYGREILDQCVRILLLSAMKLRLKGDGSMTLLRVGLVLRGVIVLLLTLMVMPLAVNAEQYSVFQSEEYGFSMKYPTNWVRIDDPKGNYYKVFQTPEPIGKVRARINVAAHKPVKAAIEVFLNEFRTAVKDLETKSGSAGAPQKVKQLDEGKFDCDVPGAHFFFIEALEEKAKVMMNVIIVFYKHQDVLLRVSCLAPADRIQDFHQMFNDVLLSVKFTAAGTGKSSPAPITGTSQPQAPAQPTMQRPRPATPTAPSSTNATPTGPTTTPRGPTMTTVGPTSPPSGPTPPTPSGPARRPKAPGTGIVQ
jgi:hypothetical protein